MKRKKLGVCFALLVVLSGSVPAYADLTIGVFPRRSQVMSQTMFRPLADYLSTTLGEPVQLIVPGNFMSFWRDVKNKKYDIVHFNQYHYIKSHKELGYNVIAVNEELGSKYISGVLVVRTDSGISTVQDLKGKRIIFGGGTKAMASFIAPTAILKKAGLYASLDYVDLFARNPPSSVVATFNHEADAGGAGNVILSMPAVTRKVDASKLKILAESDPYIQLPWAVKGEMPLAKAKKIQSSLVGIKDLKVGQTLMSSLRVTGFHSASDADFNKVREIVEYALGESY